MIRKIPTMQANQHLIITVAASVKASQHEELSELLS